MEAAVTELRKMRAGMVVQSLRVAGGSSDEAMKAAAEPPHTAVETTRSLARALQRDRAAMEEARTHAATEIGGRKERARTNDPTTINQICVNFVRKRDSSLVCFWALTYGLLMGLKLGRYNIRVFYHYAVVEMYTKQMNSMEETLRPIRQMDSDTFSSRSYFGVLRSKHIGQGFVA